ncbi:MAG TPA: protein-export chaperone SecB [Candidatus Mediterraneibacter excrementavium]|nr:protein-export chaperone SecB [Candidatus Mediterraneibacter excrementavium]
MVKESTIKNSVLTLENLYFDTIQFNRLDCISSDPELDIRFRREVQQRTDDTSKYRLVLSAELEDKERNSIRINISLVGEFNITVANREYDAERLVSENGVAILFPYLRSEITLLTSQPGLKPVVLPAVNIVEMFK